MVLMKKAHEVPFRFNSRLVVTTINSALLGSIFRVYSAIVATHAGSISDV